MKKLLLLIIIANIGIRASACQFTIREIGYSNILLEQYQLILEADSLKHKKQIEDFKSIAFAFSIGANVEYEFIHKDTGIPKISFLNGKEDEIYNSTIEKTDDIINSITTCLSSPLRERITEYIGKSFAVIVHFEGEKTSNKSIEKQISDARKKFKTVSPHLNRVVSEGVEVLKVPMSDRHKESVVLAALDVPANSTKPIVLIIYGRGRLAGDVLQEDEITTQLIFNNLVLLGTDCECGVDLSPLLENALPLNWSAETRQEITEMLDFDADNPIIMAEMSQILTKGASNTLEDHSSFVPEIFEQKIVNNQYKNDEIEMSNKTVRRTIITLIIITVVVVLIGLVLFIRHS